MHEFVFADYIEILHPKIQFRPSRHSQGEKQIARQTQQERQYDATTGIRIIIQS